MISFLASPKPFVGVAKDHQYRAIRSWQAAHSDAEVILYGEAGGIDEAGRALGATVIRGIGCSASGVPYFGAIAEHAGLNGRHGLQVYLNCDIVLSGILPALHRIQFSQFVLIGQRVDLADGLLIDVTQSGWRARLEELANEGRATLHPPTGSDFFGFRRGLWEGLPPVVIGRAGYDHALLAYCLRRDVPIIDATFAVTALHPFHDYGHVAGGWNTVWTNEDARNNFRQAGGRRSAILVSDATHQLVHSRLQPSSCRGDRLRQLELLLRYRWRSRVAGMAVRLIWRMLQQLKLTASANPGLDEVMHAQGESSGV